MEDQTTAAMLKSPVSFVGNNDFMCALNKP